MSTSQYRYATLLACSIATLSWANMAHAADDKAAEVSDTNGSIAEGSDIIVTATRPNQIAPVTSSLNTTQPQSIVSRNFIEDSLPASSDFNQIALISPSVSNYGNANGPGLSESKAQIRGFQDGEYNITYDGVPFSDQNDPTHHSNTFFPSNTIETLVVDRGPGNAGQLGQATFGGNINMFSRATRADLSAEALLSYGSYNTQLERVFLQSGAIKQLGGAEIVLSGQHIRSDGARTYSPFKSNNVYGKIMLPLGPDVKLTLLATYNENTFNQPDKDGATKAQIALYGKYFSLNNDPNSQTYYGYNQTHKTTDFELVKLESDIAPGTSFENRAYTYSYDNETLSGNDVTLFATATPAAILAANVVTLTSGGATSPGIPGYTKTNKYRVWGDIAKVRYDFDLGTLTLGAWIERSDTYRQQRDVNLLTLAPSYLQKIVLNPVSGVATPRNIRFDQNSSINQTEEFTELELRPTDGLKITPGFKHINFNRKINANYNQTTRYEQHVSDTWNADLPFLTINYQASDAIALYGQYARGFLAPPITVLNVNKPQLSTVEPQQSTNYQAGLVYHGGNLSADVAVYKIDFNNKFASFVSTVPGEGTIFINQGSVKYQGVEGQLTYALPNGLAVFVNGSRNYAKTDNAGELRTQVANAPEFTFAGGVLFKRGPIAVSLMVKYTGPQWFVALENPLYKSEVYNAAMASLNYDFGLVRVGVEVSNLFNSREVTNINAGKTVPFDQYFFQTGRSVSADLTIKF